MTPAAEATVPEAVDKKWSAAKNPEGPTPIVAEALLGGFGGIVTGPPAVLVAHVPVVPAVPGSLEFPSVNCVKPDKFHVVPLTLTCALP